jgi:tellurite resistance protein TehA-like permease
MRAVRVLLGVAGVAVLAPVTVAVLLIGARLLPHAARPAAALGLLVWGAVTLATLNVLLGVGGRPDNDTLLNRPYVPWWLALSVLWWAGVAAVALLAVRRERAGRPRGESRR